MRKTVAMILTALMLFSAGALADATQIDLSTMGLEQLMSLKTEVEAAIRAAQASDLSSDILDSATRKAPALAGQTVKLTVSTSRMSYTVLVTLKEVYRGEAYDEFMGGRYRPELKTENGEYVAVKLAVTFLSLEKAQEEDPRLTVDAIFSFDCYDSEGAQYDNVCYGVADETELKPIYEGAVTEGFMQFEVDKGDSAPYLVYKPDMFDTKVAAWFQLI